MGKGLSVFMTGGSFPSLNDKTMATRYQVAIVFRIKERRAHNDVPDLSKE